MRNEMFTGLIALLSVFSSHVSAITLLENPDPKSKTVAELSAGTELIPIYHPDNSLFIKVANPQNGQVGWVDIQALNGSSKSSDTHGFSFEQKIFSKNEEGQSPKMYRVFEYTGPKQLSQKEVQNVIEQMQQEQLKMQQNVEHLFQSAFGSFENMYGPFHGMNPFLTMPIIQPILVVPDDKESAPKNTDNTTKKKEPVKDEKNSKPSVKEADYHQPNGQKVSLLDQFKQKFLTSAQNNGV